MSVQRPAEPAKTSGAKSARVSVPDLVARKGQEPIVCLTAYTAPMARMLGDELATRLQTETAGAAAGLSKDMGPLGRLSGQLEDSGYRRLLLELGHEPTTLDELVQRTGQSAAALSSMLLMLELEGGIESLPGNRYQCLPAGFPDD